VNIRLTLVIAIWSLMTGLLVVACDRPSGGPISPNPSARVAPDVEDDKADPLKEGVVKASVSTIVDPMVLATGISGSYTVPRGYVTSISAVASSGLADAGIDAGGYGTITITPNGPGVTDGSAVVQPPIPIPAGYTYTVSRPVIQGSANELGVGTVIVFTNTQSYIVTMSLGGT
jgi:hypothetical protein